MRFALIAVLALLGCATTGDRVRQLDAGMQVVGEFTVYTYANRTMTWKDWRDKADYHIVFREDKVVQYGPGVIRQSATNVTIIPPPS
jgi:hypothetical protein